MGYINKEAPLETLVDTIRMLLAGKSCLSNDPAGNLASPSQAEPVDTPADASRVGRVPQERLALLSNRELETLQYLGQGQGTQQIARAMSRTVKTVETYRWRIRKKLGLRSSLELAQYAVLYIEQIATATK